MSRPVSGVREPWVMVWPVLVSAVLRAVATDPVPRIAIRIGDPSSLCRRIGQALAARAGRSTLRSNNQGKTMINSGLKT
jgi:hypothetical protein